ncbi:hypothetical protein A2110_01800 [Candidatus Jorgensenbacteria bacterium GWA1_54_12]|uniref:Uncharacterized protein n=1 Tax=Candidatus Jorgensenbacteria bacterium GWA1_54_12 TaxID=1798468 RepID=A0A1F6BLS2_9BACT|nr:MAG: hypothetical protein A2110_01800 [Candidatus Jorgensenbacteria bacterium GWA1_54_12]
MNCDGRGCTGVIDESVLIPLQTGCHSATPAHPCGTCGLLYFSSGGAAMSRSGEGGAFLVDREVIIKEVDLKV